MNPHIREELARLMCDQHQEPSAGLRAYLTAHPEDQEEFVEGRELVASLRATLAPEPLPAHLTAEIHARLDARMAPSRRRAWIVPLRIVGAAAAACLLAAGLIPSGTVTDAGYGGGIELSREDSAAIVEALATLRWEGPVEQSVEDLARRIDDLGRAVERDPDAASLLPWATDDDWDVPVGDSETSQVDPEFRRMARYAPWTRPGARVPKSA